jgi:hypothetical protein
MVEKSPVMFNTGIFTTSVDSVISSFDALPFKNEPCEFMSENYYKFGEIADEWFNVTANTPCVNEFMKCCEQYKNYIYIIYSGALKHHNNNDALWRLGRCIGEGPVPYATLFNAIREPEFNDLFDMIGEKLEIFDTIVERLRRGQLSGLPSVFITRLQTAMCKTIDINKIVECNKISLMVETLSLPYQLTDEMLKSFMLAVAENYYLWYVFETFDMLDFTHIDYSEFYGHIANFNPRELLIFNIHVQLARTNLKLPQVNGIISHIEFIETFANVDINREEYSELCAEIIYYRGMCHYLNEEADRGINKNLYNCMLDYIAGFERDTGIELYKPYKDLENKQEMYDQLHYVIYDTYIIELIYNDFVNEYKFSWRVPRG